MAGRWPPAELFGLHVDLGDYHTKRAVWLALPAAAFTCRWGCEHTAVGAADVADLTQSIADRHARTCPGPPKETP
ncbi:hypothetical protein PYK79_45080 [Streptomyces sp. ID05-04B]|uniref:hypothetical protein n=1 Tax=unclassified Streptomyces TaxID=2593676 RepID=UPI000D19D66C|nr:MULTISPECIES: hypothetical protein [unclassified Streptomyces]AVV46434.1 hypothetical protein C6376_38855 [Streptomyces sp. P3]AVV46493.1 hypothetical protein C6376_39155 [Streptomyces sp. P3]MDX5569022.1 hypothetical protein [Streptomyces sp. ID05-04B]